MGLLLSFVYANEVSFFFIHVYAMRQIITDSIDPPAVAIPIGNKLAKAFEVMYTPGILTSRIDARLCMKDNSERPQAQKYPLKLK